MNYLLLLQLLINTENIPHDSRAVGLDNERGLLQIRPIAMREVNRKYGTEFTVEDLSKSDTATRVGALYLQILADNFKEKEGRDITLHNLVRCWNGGPDGYKKHCTRRYWMRFHAINSGKIAEVLE